MNVASTSISRNFIKLCNLGARCDKKIISHAKRLSNSMLLKRNLIKVSRIIKKNLIMWTVIGIEIVI